MEKQFTELKKNFKRVSEKEKEKRKQFIDDINDKIFDIACPLAEKKLRDDRLLDNSKKNEDLEFLDDQRTVRKSWIGNLDMEYQRKYQKRLKRKEL